MTERSTKIAEARARRDTLYSELKQQLNVIRAISWLASQANEGNRRDYSNEEYFEQLIHAMNLIAMCAKKADHVVYGGDMINTGFDYCLFEVDRLEDR